MTNFIRSSLLGFCATEHDHREHMHAPMRCQGSAILTNGAILLRIHPVAPGLLANMRDFPHTDFLKKIDDAAARLEHQLSPLPTLPTPIPCKFCRGSGFEKTCQLCGGDGCDHCEKTGAYPADRDDMAAQACWICDGTGHERQDVDIGPATFDSRLLALIANLEGATFAPDNAEDAGYFRSVIGDGLLMPMRKSQS